MPNSGYSYRARIERADAGSTVLAYLSEHYAHATEQTWADRIRAGRVQIDGKEASAATRLEAGSVVTWNRPPWNEPSAPTSYAVLYRDDDLLAVAKPRGMPAMPGGGFLENTLLARVSKHHPEAAPLHRLGRGTSGVTLFTRRKEARRPLVNAWGRGDIGRKYVGLARGRIAWGEAAIDTPIGSAPHPVLGSVAAADANGKTATSHVHVLERRDASTLVAIEIETGRTHQIRIHLAATGHPLVGDPLYAPGGRPIEATRALPGDPGYLLHAERLTFVHPRKDESVVVTCPPPPTLRRRQSS